MVAPKTLNPSPTLITVCMVAETPNCGNQNLALALRKKLQMIVFGAIV